MISATLILASACGGDDADGVAGEGRYAGEQDVGAVLGEAVGSQASGSPEPVDLALTPSVPSTAGVSNDACGVPTTFEASNLVDDRHDTAWRMSGDASGQSITLTLDGSYRVLELGLVPGYAKVDPCDGADRFVQNRRPTVVSWIFDDGSSLSQTLTDQAELQSVAADVTTATVVLRIDGVTGAERDFTAISEISVRGV